MNTHIGSIRALSLLTFVAIVACGSGGTSGADGDPTLESSVTVPGVQEVAYYPDQDGGAVLGSLIGVAGGHGTAGDLVPTTNGLLTPDDFLDNEDAGMTSAIWNSRRGSLGRSKKTAPVRTWKRSRLSPNTTRLKVGDDEELPLGGMKVSVRIDGFRARVVLDCFYRNHLDRQLEGTFQLRLPDAASPYFFAFGEAVREAPSPEAHPLQGRFLDPDQTLATAPAALMSTRKQTWTRPREARMVRREKAAHAYGETTRRRVDPALMEWSGAGIFSSRVFPLAPGKLHRIVIGYEMNLLPVGKDLVFRLDLPDGLPECAVTLDVAATKGLSVVPAAEARREGDRALFHLLQPPARTIQVRYPSPGALLLVGEDPDTGPHFAASFRADLPEDALPGARRGIFLVDVSLSSNPERMNVWLAMLSAILEKNRGNLREFAVLFFNVECFWWRDGFSANTPENVRKLLSYAGGLSLEGATDLGAALAEAAQKEGGCDYFLLSDGAATWGSEDLSTLSSRLGGPLFAYRTGFTGTDHRTLTELARDTGGAVFSVVGEAEVRAAAEAHRSRSWRIEHVTIAGGSDLLLAGRPTSVYPGQQLYLSGRGKPGSEAEIVLTLSRGKSHREMRVKPARVIESEMAPRFYGQIAVGQLEELGLAAEEQAKAYATHYRVVGRTCSLLMLESEEDYLRFDIKPEKDAHLVRREPASRVVSQVLAERRKGRDSTKAEFLGWLHRLARMPGMDIAVSKDLMQAVERVKEPSFVVEPQPLVCKMRRWSEVPGAVREELASHELTYERIRKEAARRLRVHGAADALRALSSLVEQRPGDTATARDVAFSAVEWGLSSQAYHLYRRVARSRPNEPETYRALARCLEGMGKADLALIHYELAVTGKWSGRYGGFHQVAAMDYLRLLRRIVSGKVKSSVRAYAAARLAALEREMNPGKPGLVIMMTWNTDRTDVDLHVTDPNGETCFYSNPETKIGGRLTQDVTQGYGPEMFVLPEPAQGKYLVRARYYSSDQMRASLRTRVYTTIYRHWGTPEEEVTHKVVTLSTGREFQEIATIQVDE